MRGIILRQPALIISTSGGAFVAFVSGDGTTAVLCSRLRHDHPLLFVLAAGSSSVSLLFAGCHYRPLCGWHLTLRTQTGTHIWRPPSLMKRDRRASTCMTDNWVDVSSSMGRSLRCTQSPCPRYRRVERTTSLIERGER
ncbi:hypothetical protein BD626DRAFT_483795 [Schizophyllum amplum]|uniref:Uncharacterized protein n=1 Tax=Schizophyllum amplum TaxID=97359 RepID=A0A550CPT1_9AGAR|nr:hypothetical protein BD626DRAFT_483795 [Auriculariopsis ampla]